MADTKITRRKLLRCAAGAAGTLVAAPYVITSTALGAEGRPPASERITMCMIGIGSRGRKVLSAFLSDSRIQCLAVCDVDSRRRAQAKNMADQKNRNKDCAEYGDFRELLDRVDIDAAATATPDFWHVPIAVRACKQGKDVYCEKPLSLTIREARAAVTAARRYGRVFQVGTQNRSNPAARFGCEMVRNGGLGDLRFAEVATGPTPPVFCHLPAEPVPGALDWDMWLGPVPYRPYHRGIMEGRGWNHYREFSGGGVTDAGAHHFDLAQWALGTEDTYPVEVTPLDPAKNDGREVAFRYADGRMMYRRTPGDNIKFVGTRGTIRMLVCAWVKVSYAPKELSREFVASREKYSSSHNNHVVNFLDCVRSRKKPAADVELGCRAVTICHIGNIAQWLGRPLKWDPAKEEFIGDDEANRMCSRAYRQPWRL